MRRTSRYEGLDLKQLPSPCYIIDELAIERNCQTLDRVQRLSGCKALLAIKGFAVHSLFPIISEHLQGTCASGLYEARLGKEEFGKEVHVYSPAYDDVEFGRLLEISDHIVFNSLPQWDRFRPRVERSGRRVSCGIRINPEYSEISTELWDPCARYSRFGVRAEDLRSIPDGIEGLHFHALSQSNSDTLERLLKVVERNFGDHLSKVKWVNFGGGHLITSPDYDVDRLCHIISDFRKKHGVEVYIEPGEAVAFDAGVLLSTVLDITHNEIDIAILDISPWAHLQDVLTTSFVPEVLGSRGHARAKHRYRLASRSCLSGDIIGDYELSYPLRRGSKILFSDMASYAVVSNNIFNGLPLPAIAVLKKAGDIKILRRGEYEDYKRRLS